MNEFPLLARFNRWVNARYYACCATLSDAERRRERGAFFGSIHRTLNHILVVDRLWLGRIEGAASGIASLDQILYDDFDDLRSARAHEDERLIAFVDGLTSQELERVVRYRFIDGTPAATPLHLIFVTLFNHQAHHRGQVHALLTQTGAQVPGSDVIDFLLEGEG